MQGDCFWKPFQNREMQLVEVEICVYCRVSGEEDVMFRSAKIYRPHIHLQLMGQSSQPSTDFLSISYV